MKRIIGLTLIVLGILSTVAGFIFLVVGLDNPRNQNFGITAFAICFGLGVLAIIIGFVLWRNPNSNAKAVNGRVGKYLADVTESRTSRGIRFEVHYQTPISGKNGRPSLLTVRVRATAPTTLSLTPETRWDRLGKFLGIAREYQTGDAEFDEAIYIRTPSEPFAAELLTGADARTAVLVLLRSGFGEVKLTGTTIEAIWTGFDPVKNDRLDLAEETAEVLNMLVQSMPTNDPEFDAASDWTFPWYVALWVAGLLFAATVAFAFIYPPVRASALFVAGMAAFGFDYLIFGSLAALLLRGNSIAHDRWYLLMAVGILMIGAGSIGSLAAVNALGDSAPLVERRSPIINKHSSSGRNGTTYYATVSDWELPGNTIDFSVSANEFHRIVFQRSHMHLLTGPGRYGIEWIQSRTCLP